MSEPWETDQKGWDRAVVDVCAHFERERRMQAAVREAIDAIIAHSIAAIWTPAARARLPLEVREAMDTRWPWER